MLSNQDRTNWHWYKIESVKTFAEDEKMESNAKKVLQKPCNRTYTHIIDFVSLFHISM